MPSVKWHKVADVVFLSLILQSKVRLLWLWWLPIRRRQLGFLVRSVSVVHFRFVFKLKTSFGLGVGSYSALLFGQEIFWGERSSIMNPKDKGIVLRQAAECYSVFGSCLFTRMLSLSRAYMHLLVQLQPYKSTWWCRSFTITTAVKFT